MPSLSLRYLCDGRTHYSSDNMASAEYNLLMQGDIIGALSGSISNILPMGLAWIFIGLIIFGVVQTKTKSYGISGLIFILYTTLLIPANLVAVSIQPYLALLIGILIVIMIVKVVK